MAEVAGAPAARTSSAMGTSATRAALSWAIIFGGCPSCARIGGSWAQCNATTRRDATRREEAGAEPYNKAGEGERDRVLGVGRWRKEGRKEGRKREWGIFGVGMRSPWPAIARICQFAATVPADRMVYPPGYSGPKARTRRRQTLPSAATTTRTNQRTSTSGQRCFRFFTCPFCHDFSPFPFLPSVPRFFSLTEAVFCVHIDLRVKIFDVSHQIYEHIFKVLNIN